LADVGRVECRTCLVLFARGEGVGQICAKCAGLLGLLDVGAARAEVRDQVAVEAWSSNRQHRAREPSPEERRRAALGRLRLEGRRACPGGCGRRFRLNRWGGLPSHKLAEGSAAYCPGPKQEILRNDE